MGEKFLAASERPFSAGLAGYDRVLMSALGCPTRVSNRLLLGPKLRKSRSLVVGDQPKPRSLRLAQSNDQCAPNKNALVLQSL